MLRCSVAPCETVSSAHSDSRSIQAATLDALNGGSHERRLRGVHERQRPGPDLIEAAMLHVEVVTLESQPRIERERWYATQRREVRIARSEERRVGKR